MSEAQAQAQQTSPLAPTTSPLTEADPSAVNELIQGRIDDIFNKQPLLLNDDDLKTLVEYYQRERLRFMQESQAKELKPKTTRAKKAPTSVADAIASSKDLL